uniref:RING-type domain-containing protein n=1 Tax=Panagrellus redivivus TaxID=6233 RepID=A0A7E4UNB8_PANRE
MQSCLTTSTTSSNGDISNLAGHNSSPDSDKMHHQSRSPAMMNWSRQVSFEPVGMQNKQVLVEQLAHAKDMGFTEDDILGALQMHTKNNDAKRYAPFDSTSAMIDALTMAQKISAAPPAKDRPQSMYITRNGSQDENKSPPPPTILENNNCLPPDSPTKYNGITSTISPRSASVTRSVSFTNAPIRRPRSSYFLNHMGNSSSMLHLNYKAAANNNSSLNRLIETFNSDRKGLIEEFTKAINETKENHIHEQHAMQARLNAAIKENAEMKVQMREFNMLETRCLDMETRYLEVEAQCREKDAAIANLQEDMANFSQLIDQSNDHQRQLKAKRDQVEKLEREVADLKSKLAQSSDTNRVVTELETELTQLKTENREYREKQTVLACTTCMDEPRNVLYLPCLHFICCSTCAGPSDHCSICRNRIMGKIEVYQ